MNEWMTVADVRAWTDVTDETTDASLQLAVDAVVAYVPTASVRTKAYYTPADPLAEPTPIEESFDPPGDIKLGGIMLAARWHDRRGATLGTTGYTEFGTGTILRHDPDIARLLGLGTSATTFSFGAPSLPVEEEEA